MATIVLRPHPVPLLSASLRSEDFRLSASLSPSLRFALRFASRTFGEDLWPGTCEPLLECVIPGEGVRRRFLFRNVLAGLRARARGCAF